MHIFNTYSVSMWAIWNMKKTSMYINVKFLYLVQTSHRYCIVFYNTSEMVVWNYHCYCKPCSSTLYMIFVNPDTPLYRRVVTFSSDGRSPTVMSKPFSQLPSLRCNLCSLTLLLRIYKWKLGLVFAVTRRVFFLSFCDAQGRA